MAPQKDHIFISQGWTRSLLFNSSEFCFSSLQNGEEGHLVESKAAAADNLEKEETCIGLLHEYKYKDKDKYI